MPSNKPHKQKFASKHSIAEREQGRKVKTGGGRQRSVKSIDLTHSKERAKQQAIALRKVKNAAILEEKRIGSVSGAPKIVGFVGVNESSNSELVAREFGAAASSESQSFDFLLPTTIISKEMKQRFTVVVEREGNEQKIVDVAKVADVLVLALDCSQGAQDAIRELNAQSGDVDDEADARSYVSGATTWFSDIGLCVTDQTRELISLLNSQGLPSIVVALQGLESYSNPKRKAQTQKIHRRYFESVFGEAVKVLPLETEADAKMLVRTVSVVKLRQLMWRQIRPYMAVEGGDYDDASRRLTIHGYLRGSNISATQLVHITDHGTFQVESVALLGDPNPLGRSGGSAQGIVEASDENTRESLQCIQASDTVEEDGLPTDADVAFEQQRFQAATKRVRVPAGASEYQAAWYDVEGGDAGEVEEEQHDDTTINVAAADGDDDHFIDIDAMSKKTTHTEVDFMKVTDVVRHERMTDEERLEEMQRLKDLSEDDMWSPDMVDTPINLPARQRFEKYRGMKSFQTGVWDVNENLPIQYGHIFKLQGYSKIRDASVSKCETGSGPEGHYVTVTLLDVAPETWKTIQSSSLTIASGQLEHEQKWSMLHFHVQRNSELEEPIKSKTPMLAHIGFRKFYVTPMFSDATVGDRTKFARFFHADEKFRLASFYGPISFNPCPILLFLVPSLEEQQEDGSAALRLACFGSAQPPNPDLLILKRSVLTGRVAMINKKTVVVKFMFFNEDDVKWFQPVDIYTKLGRRGKITKAVGTHGLFKANLNDQVMQHDVICMDLYKRVFPKWTTVPFNVTEVQQIVVSSRNADDEGEENEV